MRSVKRDRTFFCTPTLNDSLKRRWDIMMTDNTSVSDSFTWAAIRSAWMHMWGDWCSTLRHAVQPPESCTTFLLLDNMGLPVFFSAYALQFAFIDPPHWHCFLVPVLAHSVDHYPNRPSVRAPTAHIIPGYETWALTASPLVIIPTNWAPCPAEMGTDLCCCYVPKNPPALWERHIAEDSAPLFQKITSVAWIDYWKTELRMASLRINPALLYTAATILPTMCSATVVARFYIRSGQKAHFGWDDWLVLPALVRMEVCRRVYRFSNHLRPQDSYTRNGDCNHRGDRTGCLRISYTSTRSFITVYSNKLQGGDHS